MKSLERGRMGERETRICTHVTMVFSLSPSPRLPFFVTTDYGLESKKDD